MEIMLTSKPVEFHIGGITLRGKLDLPAPMGDKIPLLVLLHGLTGWMDERHIEGVARAALSAGYGVLRVDQYGHGTSDGRFEDHNVMLWMLHAMQVIDEARSWPFVDWICLAGHSQGGLNTILVGGMMSDRIRALIPLSPAVNIVYGARKGHLLGAPFDWEHVPEEMTFNGRTLRSNYLRAAKMLPLEYAVGQFRGRVLIVHGTDDEAVPYECSVQLQQQFGNAALVTIPGDDHCYHSHLEQVTKAVEEFLRSLL